MTKRAFELMPQGEEAQKVLRARAEQLAKLKTEIVERQDGVAYVRFTLGKNEFYGIAYQYVSEVLQNIRPTRLPCAPGFIAGVINWRGALIPVIDIKKILHSDSAKYRYKGYGIVIRAADATMAILVNTIEGSDVYLPLNLAPPLAGVLAAKPEFIAGIDRAVTAIINMEAVGSALRKGI